MTFLWNIIVDILKNVGSQTVLTSLMSLKISLLILRKKFIEVWNDIRQINDYIIHFWVNYPFWMIDCATILPFIYDAHIMQVGL